MFQQGFYPQQQSFANLRNFPSSQPFFYRSNGPVPTPSTQNLNFTHDFERFSGPHHGFTSIPTGGYPFFDQQQQQRWRPHLPRTPQQQQQQHHHHQQQQQQQQQQHHRQTPAFHFQDKTTSYFMTDPIKTSDDRIAIQLTKVHIGPNGDQQRVLVEQEFSNEKELKKFVRNLRENFEKTFNQRSSEESSRLDESSSASSKKSGVVVVEEPDEEPKVYEQQAYNANIESKRAAASMLTPPSSPTMEPTSPSPPSTRTEQTRTKQLSPPASQMSSTSTARSNRYHRNKMKYRRQKDEQKASNIFHMPSFSRPYQATPMPPRFQQRFFHPNPEFHPTPPPNGNFQWRFHPNAFPKTRSRSYVPPMTEHFPRPPPTPARFQNLTDPFFRPTHQTPFAAPPPPPPPPRPRDFHPSAPSPAKFRRSHRRRAAHQPATITENHVYPNNAQQQQPRVHRTKSESRHLFTDQQRKSRSAATHFPPFSPLQSPPVVQRHFVPFRSPPVLLTSAPIFYPSQRKQLPNSPRQFRLMNHFHLGTQRF